jgi:hypothetical protein
MFGGERCLVRRLVARWRLGLVVSLIAVLAAPVPALAFASEDEPLLRSVHTMLVRGGFWRAGCPVGLSQLRLLTVTHWGFDRKEHTGQWWSTDVQWQRSPVRFGGCTRLGFRSVTWRSRTCTGRLVRFRPTAM